MQIPQKKMSVTSLKCNHFLVRNAVIDFSIQPTYTISSFLLILTIIIRFVECNFAFIYAFLIYYTIYVMYIADVIKCFKYVWMILNKKEKNWKESSVFFYIFYFIPEVSENFIQFTTGQYCWIEILAYSIIISLFRLI